MNYPKVVSSEEIQYNWNQWNDLRNTFNLHVIDSDASYPKYLLIRAWEWFCEEAKAFHIDVNFYQFVRITKWDCTWTVDFMDQEDGDGAVIQLYEIYYDSRNKKIMQACFAI